MSHPDPIDERLREIRERNEERTPGEWTAGNLGEIEAPGCTAPVATIYNTPGAGRGWGYTGTNATFIANCPADIDFLLDQIDSLREVERAAREQANRWARYEGYDWNAPGAEGCEEDGRHFSFMEAVYDTHNAVRALDATHRPPLSGET